MSDDKVGTGRRGRTCGPTTTTWPSTIPPSPEASDRLGLDALADEVWSWHVRELGEGTTIGKAAKVCEEAGELIGHVIKSTEPRPDAADHWKAARLEVADVILAALGAARGLGIGSIDEVVREKWATVRARRFATAEPETNETPEPDEPSVHVHTPAGGACGNCGVPPSACPFTYCPACPSDCKHRPKASETGGEA